MPTWAGGVTVTDEGTVTTGGDGGGALLLSPPPQAENQGTTAHANQRFDIF